MHAQTHVPELQDSKVRYISKRLKKRKFQLFPAVLDLFKLVSSPASFNALTVEETDVRRIIPQSHPSAQLHF